MNCCNVVLLLLALSMVDAIKYGKYYRKIPPQATQSDDNDDPITDWFQQPLDHFDKSNTNTWKQRYYVVKNYYKQGGPVFLMLEGEYEAWSGYLYGYAAMDYAQNLNAMMFTPEHRYFGKSKPVSDLTLENLQYLTIAQILADFANFISGMNEKFKLPQNTRWIVFGTSYAGTMATWMRYKYPDLVYACVSISAPLRFKLNYWEYKDHVRKVLEAFDKNCLDALKQGHLELKAALTGPGDVSGLVDKFKLCDPVDKSIPEDVTGLLAGAGSNICGVVQYTGMWSLTLKDVCAVFTDSSRGSFLDRYGAATTLIFNATGTDCLDFTYKPYIESARNLSWVDNERQAMFEGCSEFGSYQTSYLKDQLFFDDIPLKYFTQQCIDILGEKFNEEYITKGIARTNQEYGGYDTKATRIVYVNGDWDPWTELGGITTTRNPESPAILVKGESHGVCQSPLRDTDSDEKKAACKLVEALVIKWSTE